MEFSFEEEVLIEKTPEIEFIDNRYFRITHLGLEKRRVNLVEELEKLELED